MPFKCIKEQKNVGLVKEAFVLFMNYAILRVTSEARIVLNNPLDFHIALLATDRHY